MPVGQSFVAQFTVQADAPICQTTSYRAFTNLRFDFTFDSAPFTVAGHGW